MGIVYSIVGIGGILSRYSRIGAGAVVQEIKH